MSGGHGDCHRHTVGATLRSVYQETLTPLKSAAPAPRVRAPDRAWDPLIVAVAIYLLAAVGRIHQLFSVLGMIKLVATSAGIAGLLIVLDQRRDRKLNTALNTPVMQSMIVFVVWVGLSVPGALWSGGAFNELTNISKTVAMSLVMIMAVRGIRDVGRLAGAYYLGAVIYASVIFQRFQLGGSGGNWRLGGLIYYDANDLAILAVSGIPIGLYLIFRKASAWSRWLAAAGVPMLAMSVINSGSRGGFIAMIAMMAYLLFRFTAIKARWRMGAVGFAAVMFLALASDEYWSQMGTITDPSKDYNMTDDTGRVKIWKRGFGYMMDNPIFGVGAGNFPTAEGTISPLVKDLAFGKGYKMSAAHNSYVQTGAELGFPGLAIFASIIVTALAALREVKRNTTQPTAESGDARRLMQALTATMIGLLVGMVFLSFAYKEMLYCVVALAAGLAKVTRAQRPNRASALGGPQVASALGPDERARSIA